MAKILNQAQYSVIREVELGSILPGHTVLVKDPSGVPCAYTICKLGNTPIEFIGREDSCILANSVTGRIVLKHSKVLCNVVSSNITLTDFNGEFHVRQ